MLYTRFAREGQQFIPEGCLLLAQLFIELLVRRSLVFILDNRETVGEWQ